MVKQAVHQFLTAPGPPFTPRTSFELLILPMNPLEGRVNPTRSWSDEFDRRGCVESTPASKTRKLGGGKHKNVLICVSLWYVT